MSLVRVFLALGQYCIDQSGDLLRHSRCRLELVDARAQAEFFAEDRQGWAIGEEMA